MPACLLAVPPACLRACVLSCLHIQCSLFPLSLVQAIRSD